MLPWPLIVGLHRCRACPQGTADAVRQYMWLFDEACRDGVEDFLILSGEEGGRSHFCRSLKQVAQRPLSSPRSRLP